jgi:hypothetical protein
LDAAQTIHYRDKARLAAQRIEIALEPEVTVTG